MGDAREGRRRKVLRYAVPVLWVLVLDAWFQGPLLRSPGLTVTVLLAGLLAVAAVTSAWPVRLPALDLRRAAVTAGVLGLATLVRLPALAAPASLISSDSAVAGIIAQELRTGQLPAPIYAPGFPYEGTLKPHLTALVGIVLPPVSTPALYAWTSHAFYLLWTVCVMALARGVAGHPAALAAGLYMALSPRFLTAFSLNNVGQYPEVNALGALALVLLARDRGAGGGPSLLGCGLALGLAVWQQLLGVYFVVTVILAVLVTPTLRRPLLWAEGLLGFGAGSYPLWVWNLTHAGATFELFRRGGKHPADRLAGLPDRLDRTLTVSFPKLFGLTDLDAPAAVALLLGAVLPGLVLVMAWRLRGEIRERRGRHPALLVATLLIVVVSIFAVSKFSHRGAQRPRYLMPIYTSVAVAFGWGIAASSRRSRTLGVLAALGVLGANVAGLRPWLLGRAPAEARDRAILQRLTELGIRTGYSGFWVAPKLTFLSEGHTVLSGELGPDVSWVHPRHAALVREIGPDAYVVPQGVLADAAAARFGSLGVPFERSEAGGLSIFHHFGRRVALEEMEGYDHEAAPSPGEEEPE